MNQNDVCLLHNDCWMSYDGLLVAGNVWKMRVNQSANKFKLPPTLQSVWSCSHVGGFNSEFKNQIWLFLPSVFIDCCTEPCLYIFFFKRWKHFNGKRFLPNFKYNNSSHVWIVFGSWVFSFVDHSIDCPCFWGYQW